jgi:hypothetical protein
LVNHHFPYEKIAIFGKYTPFSDKPNIYWIQLEDSCSTGQGSPGLLHCREILLRMFVVQVIGQFCEIDLGRAPKKGALGCLKGVTWGDVVWEETVDMHPVQTPYPQVQRKPSPGIRPKIVTEI